MQRSYDLQPASTWKRGRMSSLALIACITIASGQGQTGPGGAPFSYVVNTAMRIDHPVSVGTAVPAVPIAAVEDPNGAHQEFISNQLVLHTRNVNDLQIFLTKYGGRVVSRGAVPPPPPGIPVQNPVLLPPSDVVVIAVDPQRAPLDRLAQNAQRLGLRGTFRYSSDEALRLTAIIAEERVAGHKIGLDVMPDSHSVRKSCIYKTIYEQPSTNTNTRGLPYMDGFQFPWMNDPALGIDQAWKLLEATAGARTAIAIAIIDGGFAPNADLPANAPQYNFETNTYDATGPNNNTCTGGASCPWHGTQVASTAAAIPNNLFGTAGTGGRVSRVMYFKARTYSEQALAVRTAVSWIQSGVVGDANTGAVALTGVINMSFGGSCGWFCDEEGLNDAVLEAANAGIIPVASAGNDNQDVEDNNIVPCKNAGVICVGAIDTNKNRALFSNYGSRVDIWAPGLNVVTTPTPASGGALTNFSGTSAASPFVAGVIAMMKAMYPYLTREQVKTMLQANATRVSDPQVNPGIVNAAKAVQAVGSVGSPNVVFGRFGDYGWKWHDGFGFGSEEVAVGDFNGDCRDDVVAFRKGFTGEVFVALSTGSSFWGTGMIWLTGFCTQNEVCRVGDFNGDGMDDLASFNQSTGQVRVALSTGTGFAPPIVWADNFSMNTSDTILVGDFGGLRQGEFGSGYADIALITRPTGPAPSALVPSPALVYVATSNGSGFVPKSLWGTISLPSGATVLAGNANGDLFDDLITFYKDSLPEPGRGDVYVSQSTGSSFNTARKWNEFFSVGAELPAIGDVDFNGTADIITFARNAGISSPGWVWVGLSRGTPAFSPGTLWNSGFCFWSETCMTGDFDGDGRSDVVAFTLGTTGDVYVSRSSAP